MALELEDASSEKSASCCRKRLRCCRKRLCCFGSEDPEEGPEEEIEEAVPLKEKLGNLLIALVNPKFKMFNRPLLLAFLVSIFTFALFAMLYKVMLNDCQSSTFTGTPSYLAKLYESGEIACIDSLSKQAVTRLDTEGRIQEPRLTNEPCFFAPPIADTMLDLWDIDFWNDTQKFYDEIGMSFRAFQTHGLLDEHGNDVGFRGNIVPNHDRRPELAVLRSKDLFCEGSVNRDLFYGDKEFFGYPGSTLREYDFMTWEERLNKHRASRKFEIEHWDGSISETNEWEFGGYGAFNFSPWHPYQAFSDQCELSTQPWCTSTYNYDTDECGALWTPEVTKPCDKNWNEGQCNSETKNGVFLTDSIISGSVVLQLPISGFPTVASYLQGTESTTEETTLVAEYQSCPSSLATLGSALGYTAYIELAVTLVVISLLMACRVIVNNQWGYRRIVKEIVAEALSDEPQKTKSPKRTPRSTRSTNGFDTPKGPPAKSSVLRPRPEGVEMAPRDTVLCMV